MRILKKFFNYFILFIFICFIFPAILTNNRQNNKSKPDTAVRGFDEAEFVDFTEAGQGRN